MARVGGGRSTNVLTWRERLFVSAYLRTQNASRAAALAGFGADGKRYSDETPRALLRKPHIALAIEEATARILKRYEVTDDFIVHELAKIAKSNMADYLIEDSNGKFVQHLEGADYAQMAAVAEYDVEETTSTVRVWRTIKETEEEIVETSPPLVVKRRTKLKLHGKREALMDLARLRGMIKDASSTPNEDLRTHADRLRAAMREMEALTYVEPPEPPDSALDGPEIQAPVPPDPGSP